MTPPAPKAPPVSPLPSATILLIRDRSPAAAEGIEVLMLQRHSGMGFMPNALVFPGGKVDQEDYDLLDRLRGGEGDAPESRALRVAAIREAFEEAGLLLARRCGSTAFVSGEEAAALADVRAALNSRRLKFRDFVMREDLELAGDALVRFAHWITPRFAPQRFDVHFFLAVTPPGQEAVHDGGELVDSVWIVPEEGLNAAHRRERPIMFPTYCNLHRLGESRSVTGAFEAARRSKIVCIEPWMEDRPDGRYTCIPKDVGYAVTEHRHEPDTDGVRRR